MHIYAIVSSINTGILTFLGLFVFLKKPKGVVQRWWLFLSLCAAGWSFGTIWANNTSELEISLFWYRILNYFAAFVPYFFIKFVSIYIFGRDQKPYVTRTALSLSVLILIVAIGFPKTFVNNVQPGEFFNFTPLPGPFYHLYALYFFATVIYCLFLLYRGYKVAGGAKRNQLKYLFVSMLIAFSGGGSTFLLLYGVEFPYGNFYFSLYALIMSYAIVTHHLLDIEVIIRKTLVFAGIVAAAVAVVAIPIVVIQGLIGKAIGIHPTLLMVMAAGTAVLIYRPFERRLVDLTDRFLFQKKYDYRKLLKDAAAGISQIKSLNQLLSLVVHFITMRVRTQNASVLLHDEKNNYFTFAYARGYSSKNWLKAGHIFSKNDPLIDYFEHERQPLDIEQVKEYVDTGGPKKNKGQIAKQYDYKLIIKRMNELLAHCCVPSFLGKRLLGVLILGEKKSGDVYSDEDLAVLFTIAQESAIAIENARLYDEAIERARELELVNQELNHAQTNLMRSLNETELANRKLQVTQASLIVAEKSATMVGMAKAIGHEVNNPLSIVMARMDRLNGDYLKHCRRLIERHQHLFPEDDFSRIMKLLSESDDASQRAVRAAHRINAVIHTLTNILIDSKGEMAPLSLAVLCREAIAATGLSTYEENLSGCDIRTDIAANVMIFGNLEQLLQVFVNLIKNAYEAMVGQRDRRIEIKGDFDPDDSKMARIEFSDNGPGIPSEILPKIWQQGFTTKVRKDEGIGASGQGQGLFVVKHMVESVHKGLVTVTSTAGKGTTFVIKLPLAEAKETG